MKRSNFRTGPKVKPGGSKVNAAVKGTKLPQPVQYGATKSGSSNKSLVRYISKELVLKITGKDMPIEVTTINLVLNKGDGKKIKFIENLEPFTRIQVLRLAYNQIAKIEHLDRLTKIQDLDLSCNCIAKIEGLETLVNLRRLNLSDNLIEMIPVWVGKKLRALRVFHITGNMLFSLTDISRLRHLQDLTELAVASNPMCELPHHRLYTVFHLRSLEALDGVAVVDKERHDAETRFGQEEIENLGGQLEKEGRKLRNLEVDHNKSILEAKKVENKMSDMKKKQTEERKRIKTLERELQAKDDLLNRKTAELTKACQKHYKLEQELAFHKIDAKFEPLGYFPDTAEIEGGTEESAYIGRASYKRNQYAGEHYVLPGSHTKTTTRVGGDYIDGANVSPQIQQQMHRVLDDQMVTKQKQIAKAQERLSQLQDQLDKTERNIQDADEELDRVTKTTPRGPLSEDEKQELQRQLFNKVQAVNELRESIAQIEDGMHRTLEVIQEKDDEINRLKKQLGQIRQGEPGYTQAEAAIAEKEQQVSEADKEYANLQNDLGDSLDLLEQEMKKVKRLQRQVANEEVEMNDALKQELEDVVDGLSNYLSTVQEQQVRQQKEADALKKERDQLLQRLREVDAQRGEVSSNELEALQQQMNDTEAALRVLEEENESLRQAQTEASIGADNDKRLRDAEEDADRIKDALEQQQRQAQAERDALQKQLAADRKKLKDAAMKARAMGDKEEEARHTAGQLVALQAENKLLVSRLQNQESEMDDLLNTSLNPENVAGRIQQAGRNIEHGGGRTHPSDGGDAVGLCLADLEGQIGERLKQLQKDKDLVQSQKAEADAEIQALRDQLSDIHQRYSQDTAQAQEEADKLAEEAEVDEMRNEVGRLQEQLAYAQDTRQPEQAHHQQEELCDPQEERLKQMAKMLDDTDRQMRENDLLAAQELAAAGAQIRQLRDEIGKADDRDQSRQRREAERQRQAALAEAEAYVSAQAQRAAEELARAQDEIDGLERALTTKDTQLQDEMQQSGRASQTVAIQQQEIGALYDTLEEQKGEILRLQRMLNRLTEGPQGPTTPEVNSDLQNLMREIGELRDAIQHQGNTMSNLGQTRGPDHVVQPQYPPNVTANHASAGHHPVSHGRFFATSPYPNNSGRVYSQPQGWQSSLPVRMPDHSHQPATHQPIPGYGSQPFVTQQQPSMHTSHPIPHSAHQPTVSGSTKTTFQPQPSVPLANNRATFRPQFGASKAVDPGVPVVETVSGGKVIRDETPQMGRLKRAKPLHGELFCNVPEHNDLEDEIAHLEKLLKEKTKKERRNSTGTIEQLQAAMTQRRDELDALDLAVGRQRKRLNQLKEQDEDLRQEKSDTLRHLNELKKTANEQAKLVHRRVFMNGVAQIYPEEEDYNDIEVTLREGDLEDEIQCLERTLAKRRAELREADRLLQECTSDLREAQDRARETLEQYDTARASLQRTREDAEAIENRVSDTAHHLLDAEQQLVSLRADIQDLEEVRGEKEMKIAEVERIIITKDAEHRALEMKTEQATDRLQKLQAELILGEQREIVQQKEARERAKILSGRNAELEKLQDQIDHQQEKLSHLNREIGEKQRELQSMTSDIDRNRRELVSALREGEGEITDTQQKMKEAKGHLEELQSQKRDLASVIDAQRSELALVRNKIDQDNSTLRELQLSMDKQQAELKHSLEMIQLEKTELEALRLQHENKMADLEKAQLAALEGKANLENLETDSQQMQAEVQRTKQLLERQKIEKQRLERELQTLGENVKGLEKARDDLNGNCLTLETELGQLQRQKQHSKEDTEHRMVKLQQLNEDLKDAQKELDETNSKKSAIKKEFQTIKNQLKENKSKLKALKKQLDVNDDQKHLLVQEVSEKQQQKSEVEGRLLELQSAVQQAHTLLAESSAEERHKQDVLHQLEAKIEECHFEIDEKKHGLERVQDEVDREEAKLSRLIGALTVEAEGIKGEVADKRQELDRLRSQVTAMDRDLESKQIAVQRLTQTQGDFNQLKEDLTERDEEKTRLAEALNFSHSELESLRKEKHLFAKKIAELKKEADITKEQLREKQKDYEHDREKLLSELNSLSEAAEEHSSKADRLGRELNSVTEQYIRLQLQLNSQGGANSRDRQLTASLEQLRSEIKSEVSHGLKDLEMSRIEVLDELQELHEQKAELTRQLQLLHSNMQGARLEADVDRDGEYLRDLSISQDKSWRKEEMHYQLEQEQDHLKLKIQQRMSRQARILDGVKQKSQATLHNLKRKLQNLEDLVNSNSRSRTELKDELDVDRVFQSFMIPSSVLGGDLEDSQYKSCPTTNLRTEQPEHDAYTVVGDHQSTKSISSEKVSHKLKAEQLDRYSLMGDASAFSRGQAESDCQVRGISKKTRSTTDDSPAGFRLIRTGSASDDVLASHRSGRKSPPEMLTLQPMMHLPTHTPEMPPSPSHSYSNQRHSQRIQSPHRPERDTQSAERDPRMQDFMESIKRLKEEKLAEIGRVSKQTS